MLGCSRRDRGVGGKLYSKGYWERHIEKGLGGSGVGGIIGKIKESMSGVREIEVGLSIVRVREGVGLISVCVCERERERIGC